MFVGTGFGGLMGIVEFMDEQWSDNLEETDPSELETLHIAFHVFEFFLVFLYVLVLLCIGRKIQGFYDTFKIQKELKFVGLWFVASVLAVAILEIIDDGTHFIETMEIIVHSLSNVIALYFSSTIWILNEEQTIAKYIKFLHFCCLIFTVFFFFTFVLLFLHNENTTEYANQNCTICAKKKK